MYLDLERTRDKACGLIEEAGRDGANLVVFPEAFVSGYPVWVWFIPPGQPTDPSVRPGIAMCPSVARSPHSHSDVASAALVLRYIVHRWATRGMRDE